jgi:hypothetical protein
MSNGSHEPEHPRDVQCNHCGRYFRNDGIHAHEENCPLAEVDETIVPLANDGGGPVPPNEEVQGGQPAQDGEGVAPDPVGGDGLENVDNDPVRTDGGESGPAPADPPEPPEPVDDDQDELPDRYVPVEVWCDRIEDERPELTDDELWGGYRGELIRRTDYVDIQETDAERGDIVAYPEEEIDP